MQNQTFISILSILIAATGISLVFKDYLASLLGGFILRRIGQVTAGVRIKILITPAITTKGDVISVGAIRTSLHEVGDGERLPSVRTGRTRRHSRDAVIHASSPVERGRGYHSF